MLNRPGNSSIYSQSPLKPPKYPAPNQSNSTTNSSSSSSNSNFNNSTASTNNNNNNNNSNTNNTNSSSSGGSVAVSSLAPLLPSSTYSSSSTSSSLSSSSAPSAGLRSVSARKTSPSFGPSTSPSPSLSSNNTSSSSYSQYQTSNGIDTSRRRPGVVDSTSLSSSSPPSAAWPSASSNRNFSSNSSYSSFKSQSSLLTPSSSYIPRKTSSGSINGSRMNESPTPTSPTPSWEEEGREEERNGQTSSSASLWSDYENSATSSHSSSFSPTPIHHNHHQQQQQQQQHANPQLHTHGRPHIPAHSISYTAKESSLTSPSPSPSPSFSSQPIPSPSTVEKEIREGKQSRDPNTDLDFGLDLKKFGLDDLSDDEGGSHSQQSTGTNESGANDSTTGGAIKPELPKESGETTIHMLSLLYDPPVDGCELKPYVSILEPSTATSRSHVTAITADNSSFVNFVWSRGDRRICAIQGCGQGATMQCLSCLKLDINLGESYFCSEKCWREGWPIHRALHSQKSAEKLKRKESEEETTKAISTTATATGEGGEVKGWSWPSWHSDDGLADPSIIEEDPNSPSSIYCKYPPPPVNRWVEVSRERVYVPSAEDVGCALRLECTPANKQTAISSSSLTVRIETGPTLPTPPLPPARPVIYNEQHTAGNAGNVFKIVDYNILAQVYATRQLYPYTPIWALQWDYRKNRILAELLQYNADIICLQEVQANVFDDFFLPQLNAVGYDGMYKRKTREGTTEDANTIDGCATFYKRDRFTLVEQYGIEYNEAARQQTMDRKSLRRLMKGNIALVVVLEENTPSVSLLNGMMRRSRKKRVCIANTHMYWDPEFADVKLWQTYILCQELEKLVLHRNLPLVLCGDFNSLVDSSVYELLVTQSVEVGEDVYGVNGVGDICHILPQRHAHNHSHHSTPVLTHHLALTSAYAGIGEPKYTNFTGHFVGVLDYVFFSRRHLRWVSVMEVEEERRVRQYTALPSPLYASDHLPLVVEMEWIPEM